jgi:hypothetical protein
MAFGGGKNSNRKETPIARKERFTWRMAPMKKTGRGAAKGKPSQLGMP